MLGLFMLVSITSVFFRADKISDAIKYLQGIFSVNLLSVPFFPFRKMAIVIFAFILMLLLIEWITREKEHPFSDFEVKISTSFRWTVYYIIAILIFVFAGQGQQFIYFQF
jgi:alginate O-acetyltransferase complex protein AlgI